MAIFKIERNRNYTVMANYHLRDKNLSNKARGLLSTMLSLPDEWDYTVRGLAAICKDGKDSIISQLHELETCGYLVRVKVRDDHGRIRDVEYNVYERPHTASPDTESPYSGNPNAVKPHTENSTQRNKDISNYKPKQNTDARNYPSINLDRTDEMDEREAYEEIIKENLEYDFYVSQKRYDIKRLDEIIEIMLDAVCSNSPTIRINGEDMPQQVVKSRFLKLNSSHIEYVFDAMQDCPSDIRNIRAYLLTTLYNATLTIDNYYAAKVNHDYF